MYCIRKIKDDIYFVGGSDRKLKLFENIFPIQRGVSYNSYLISDEKTVLLDTADISVGKEFIENVKGALAGRKLDYIIVNHMEPDHCAMLEDIVLRYPQVKIVGNAKTFAMIKQFFDFDVDSRAVVVKEGDELNVGKHNLTFVTMPMVHWPEAMATYDKTDKILFSADAFGSFGALNGTIFNDEINFDRDWIDDARRYYTNIVGKYGAQVQAVLKKASAVEIEMICPLHGPVWRNDFAYLLDKYDKWSSYQPEVNGVVIAYASMYGNTENAVNCLAFKLAEMGVKNIAVYDVSNTHISTLIAESFKYSHIVLASPTYNGGIYPVMESFLNDMKALNVQNRTVAVIDNGTWAATAGKQIVKFVEEMKNMTLIEGVSVKSALKDDADITALAQAIAESIK